MLSKACIHAKRIANVATSYADSVQYAKANTEKLLYELTVFRYAMYQWFNGLLFHMTQTTSRSTIRSHCTKQNQLLVNIRANENAMAQ